MAKDCTGKLTRSALGKVAFIGELYDARTEMFCSRSLFTSSFPKDFIKNQQNSKCTIEYSFSDQLSERFNLLKVEPELKLSILLGTFTLEGHGKYLQEGKKSERTVSCSLLYNFSTVCEKLMTAFNEIVPFIDNDVFEEEEYTHVVTEINWGANCTIILEHHNSDVSKEMEAKGALKAELVKFSKLIKPEVNSEIKGGYTDKTKINHFDLKVYADVLPDEGIPNTVEKASEFISKLPELVKPLNDGKGKPLKYAMMPLAIFMKICNYNRTIPTTITNIHEAFIDDLVFFFEDLAVLKQKLNDLQTDFSKYQKYVRSDCKNEIRKMLHKIKGNETRLKEYLAVHLPKARAGEIPVDDLIEKTEHYQTSDINLNDIETFINDFKPTRSKLNEINLYLQKGIIYLGKDEDLDSLMIENTNHDFFVLYTSEQLKKVNPVFTRKILNFFLSKAENSKVKHVVVDLDVNPIVAEEVDTLKISHYRNGFLISSNIYQDKSTTLDQKKEEEDGKDLLNLAKLEYSPDMYYVSNKPVNSDVLKLPCPGYLYETCSKEPLVWHCTVCKAVLEHCSDDYFYCKCGKAKSEAYELKCSSPNHGDKYLPVLPLRIELSNEECFTDKECLTNEECFDVPQGNHFDGEELFS